MFWRMLLKWKDRLDSISNGGFLSSRWSVARLSSSKPPYQYTNQNKQHENDAWPSNVISPKNALYICPKSKENIQINRGTLCWNKSLEIKSLLIKKHYQKKWNPSFLKISQTKFELGKKGNSKAISGIKVDIIWSQCSNLN